MFDANMEQIKASLKGKTSPEQEKVVSELLGSKIRMIDGLRHRGFAAEMLDAPANENSLYFTNTVDGLDRSYKMVLGKDESTVEFYCYDVKKHGEEDTNKNGVRSALFNQFGFRRTSDSTEMSFPDRGNVVKVIKLPDDGPKKRPTYLVQIFTSGAQFERVSVSKPIPDDAFRVKFGGDLYNTDRDIINLDNGNRIATIANPMGVETDLKLMWLVGSRVNAAYVENYEAQMTTERERKGRR